MLEEFLERPKVAPLLAKEWVDVMIDTDRMTHGKKVMERLKGERQGGLPWMVVLDADGKELITSNDEKGGNIGAPAQPEEIAHFMTMLRTVKQHLTDAEVATVLAELNEHAMPYQRPRK